MSLKAQITEDMKAAEMLVLQAYLPARLSAEKSPPLWARWCKAWPPNWAVP